MILQRSFLTPSDPSSLPGPPLPGVHSSSYFFNYNFCLAFLSFWLLDCIWFYTWQHRIPIPIPVDPSDPVFGLRFTEWLFLSVLVPPPRQLTLERQLNKSILIGWNHPDGTPPETGQIALYHVYVDGILRTTVRATDRSRALIEGVDSSKVHPFKIYSTLSKKINFNFQKF